MEPQYSEHQQGDTIEQLEYKVQTQTDAIKHYKKVGWIKHYKKGDHSIKLQRKIAEHGNEG